MTDTTGTQTVTAAAPQNYVLYRTQARGWQGVGYVIMPMMLASADAFTAPEGMAVGLDAEKAYPAASIYTPATAADSTSSAASATTGTEAATSSSGSTGTAAS